MDTIKPYEYHARRFCKALEELTADKDKMENFETYLSIFFKTWIEKYANTPDAIIEEIERFTA